MLQLAYLFGKGQSEKKKILVSSDHFKVILIKFDLQKKTFSFSQLPQGSHPGHQVERIFPMHSNTRSTANHTKLSILFNHPRRNLP